MEYSVWELIKKIWKYKLIVLVFVVIAGIYGYMQSSPKEQKSNADYQTMIWVQDHNENKMYGGVNDYAAINPTINDLTQSDFFAKKVKAEINYKISLKKVQGLLTDKLQISQTPGSTLYKLAISKTATSKSKTFLKVTANELAKEIKDGYTDSAVKVDNVQLVEKEVGKLSTSKRAAITVIYLAIGFAVGVIASLGIIFIKEKK
ncbi:MAG: hypothetical protein LBT37_04615 [Lactobacillaceae bacterium]|jgi:capsular polysaccharide biosynthesis protein|nr:hypothetical protein [Lactobacillaceae bacterium]